MDYRIPVENPVTKTKTEWLRFFASNEPLKCGINADTAWAAYEHIWEDNDLKDDEQRYAFSELFTWEHTAEGTLLWNNVCKKIDPHWARLMEEYVRKNS